MGSSLDPGKVAAPKASGGSTWHLHHMGWQGGWKAFALKEVWFWPRRRDTRQVRTLTATTQAHVISIFTSIHKYAIISYTHLPVGVILCLFFLHRTQTSRYIFSILPLFSFEYLLNPLSVFYLEQFSIMGDVAPARGRWTVSRDTLGCSLWGRGCH